MFATLLGAHPASTLCRWDCRWYTGIAAHGYDLPPLPGLHGHLQRGWPFLPVTPALIAAVRAVSGLPGPAAASVMASLCTFAVAVLGVVYRAASRGDGCSGKARASTWLLLCVCQPFGALFATGYSEAPYAMFALATLFALRRGLNGSAGLACAVLILTRPSGIVFGVPLGVACLVRAASARFPASLLALGPGLAALVPLFAWMAYCRLATGDPLVFVHAQSGWERHLANPAAALVADTAKALRPGGPHGLLLFVGMAIAGFAAAALQAFRGRPAEGFTLAGTILLALSSGSTQSMGRFVGANPVFLLTLADLIDRVSGRLPRLAALLVLLAIEIVCVRLWVGGWTGLV